MSELVRELLLFNANSSIFHIYHCENKSILNGIMEMSALYQTDTLRLQCQLSLKQQSALQTCRSTWKQYPKSEPTSIYSYSFMLCVQWRSSKYNVYSLWIDPIGDLPIYHTRDDAPTITPTMRCKCNESTPNAPLWGKTNLYKNTYHTKKESRYWYDQRVFTYCLNKLSVYNSVL